MVGGKMSIYIKRKRKKEYTGNIKKKVKYYKMSNSVYYSTKR
jgi:hypothetical protein